MNENEKFTNVVINHLESPSQEKNITRYAKILSALFYAFSSFFIVLVNKIVLTSYSFPSYQCLALSQLLASVIILYIGKVFRVILFPDFSIFPLPLFYLGNLLTGLGGTKYLSLPMFTVLRRFSIVLTLIGEWILLRVVPSLQVQGSVFCMIFGAIVAASHDLAFNVIGYILVFINNFMTAANGVIIKHKLRLEQFDKQGLVFYNSFCSILPVLLLTYSNEFGEWSNISFILCFILSCVMGFILNYSIVLCVSYNSALTTTVIGCLKNIIVTYCGMIIGGDYVFSGTNFLVLLAVSGTAGSLFFKASNLINVNDRIIH